MAREAGPRTAESEGQVEVEAQASQAFLINPNFARLWLGQALSGFGDVVFETTLIVWIAADLGKGHDWAAYAVSALLIAQAIPALLVGPFAGALVDRWRDKRHVLLVADLISAGLIAVLLILAGIIRLPGLGVLPLAGRLVAIFGIVLSVGVVGQFFRPASSVVLRDIVPEEELPHAAGYNQTAYNLSLLIGPSLAAPLLFGLGAAWALVINAASFVASFYCNHSLRLPRQPDTAQAREPAPSSRELLREMRDGLRFFRRSRVLMTLALAIILVEIGAGVLASLDVFFVTKNLATPAKSYGYLGSAQGAGMVIGSLIWTRLTPKLGLTRALWLGLAGIGIALMIYARMTSFLFGLIMLLVIGVILPAANITVGPIMYRVTPRELIGRVSATLNPLIYAALLLGMFGGGLLYGAILHNFDATLLGFHFGPIDTIFLAAGFLILLGGLYAATLRLPDAAP